MKKSFVWILLFTFLICACSSKQPPAAVPTVQPEQPAEETAAAEKPQGEMMFSSFVYASLDTEGKRVWTDSDAGIKEFRVPDAWTNAEGGIRAWYGYEIDAGKGLTKTDIIYIPSSEEAYDALVEEVSEIYAHGMDNEASMKKAEEVSVNFQNSVAVLFSVVGVPGNGSPEKARELMLNSLMNSWLLSEDEAKAQLEEYTFIPAGTAEDYSFYLITSPRDVRNAFDGDKASWKKEFDELQKDVSAYAENFTFMRPTGLANMTSSGNILRFETRDLDGNTISSSDLFAGHKATMINVWTTTCVGCISEMPELNRMAKEFEEKGGQIVGIVYDALEPDQIEEAKEIVSDLHIEFRNLLPTDEIKQSIFVQSFPTTYFVNEKGELVSTPAVGTQLQAYRSRMNELLEK